MASIGQTLKAARESKHMEIQDVVAATLMQPHVVSAIENDDFASMPAPVYARGFIRLYAESMGLDPAPFIEAYNNRGKAPFAPPKTKLKEQAPATKPMPAERSAQQKPPAPPAPPPRAPDPKPAPEPRRQERIRQPIRFRMPKLPSLPKPGIYAGAAARRLGALISRVKTSFAGARMPRLDIARMTAPLRAGAGTIGRHIGRISLPSISISADAAVILLRSTLAIVFLAAAVSGILWFTEHSKPRVFDSRLMQEPPEPYVEFQPVKQ